MQNDENYSPLSTLSSFFVFVFFLLLLLSNSGNENKNRKLEETRSAQSGSESNRKSAHLASNSNLWDFCLLFPKSKQMNKQISKTNRELHGEIFYGNEKSKRKMKRGGPFFVFSPPETIAR